MNQKNITTDQYHFFLTDEFSQWYPSKFEDERGIEFNCCEQWMMYCKAEKFNEPEIMKKILATNDPKEMKKLGREIKNFDKEIWDSMAYDIVVMGNIMKFSQNPELWEILKKTNDKILVEAADYDSIWGIGLKAEDAVTVSQQEWKGLNQLGKALMETREFLTDTPELIVEQSNEDKKVFNFYDSIGQKTIRLSSTELSHALGCELLMLKDTVSKLNKDITLDYYPFVKEGMTASSESLLEDFNKLNVPNVIKFRF